VEPNRLQTLLTVPLASQSGSVTRVASHPPSHACTIVTVHNTQKAVLQLSPEQARNLKIKAGAVQRLTKEYLYYFKEKDQEEKKLQGMRDKEGDPYDIKQQENVVQESSVMIPATRKSLESQLAELRSCIQELGDAYASSKEQKEETDKVVASAEEAL
jgi:tubulin-specific chaperone A